MLFAYGGQPLIEGLIAIAHIATSESAILLDLSQASERQAENLAVFHLRRKQLLHLQLPQAFRQPDDDQAAAD